MSKIVETSLSINDWFANLKHEIDLYITDPPYPFDNRNGAGRFKYIDGEDYMYHRLTWAEMGDVYEKMYDNASDGGRAYVFCNRDGFRKTWDLMEEKGWKVRNVIVWDKVRMGMGYHWRNSVEFILYATKGKPPVYVKGRRNLFQHKKPTKNDAIPSIGYNPEGTSVKPYQIWSEIVEYGAIDGDVVADPFAGSNPLRAALLVEKDLKNKVKLAYTNSFEI